MSAEKENLNDRSLRVTRLLDAPVSLVWEAWSRPEHITQWWGPTGFTDTTHEWDFSPGGYWRHTMHGPDGTDYPNEARFREIVKHERIVYQHFNPEFTATIEFKAEGNKTHITWTMVFESREVFEMVVRQHKADRGLVQNVDKLEVYLTAQPVVVERILNAPVSLVWQALTEKDKMEQWFLEFAVLEPRVGFEFTFAAGKGNIKYIHLCRVTEVVVNKKLSFTWRYEGYAGDSLVVIDLFPDGDTTRLKLTHTGLETFPPVADLAKENFNRGWNNLMDALQKVVEE